MFCQLENREMEKLVSAIITTHNRKELLKRAIESVLSQTYAHIELIVVDDASDDGTSEICKDSRIHYIFIPKGESRGGNYARNLGVKSSRGEYCAFLDDDDFWLPEKIEKQVALFEGYDCEIVHCGRRLEIVKSNKVLYKNKMPRKAHCGDMHERILFTICTTTSCIMCKRKALLEIGLFDENLRFWQEYELTIRLAQRKPFYYVNEPLTVYRIDAKDKGRLTNKYYAWKRAVAYVYDKHSVLYEKLGWGDKLAVRMMFLNDAKHRSKAARLRVNYLMLNLMSFPALAYLYLRERMSLQ